MIFFGLPAEHDVVIFPRAAPKLHTTYFGAVPEAGENQPCEERNTVMGNKIGVCSPQPTFVIVEQLYLKPGLPSVGNTVGPTLQQVLRRVIQVCDAQDVYFKGQRLSGMPSTWQYIQDMILPGQQITTRPTGERRLILAYAGFRNIVQPLPWTETYDLGTPPTPYTFGADPIPTIQLYGNQKVEFVMPAGKPPPTAVAIYNRTSNTLEMPSAAERDRVIQQLIRATPPR